MRPLRNAHKEVKLTFKKGRGIAAVAAIGKGPGRAFTLD